MMTSARLRGRTRRRDNFEIGVSSDFSQRERFAAIPSTVAALPAARRWEFDELVEDVRRHGVREAIWLYEEKILDGRNRQRAAAVAGFPCPTRTYDGDDPLGFGTEEG
jgi:hypothetical protein